MATSDEQATGTDATTAAPGNPNQKQQENVWLNFGFNLIVPILLLTKGGDWLPFLPPAAVLVIALAFPVGYFIYDLRTRGKKNFVSVVGVVSILLTGGIGLLKLPPEYIAIKEALVPAVLGLAVIISLKTRYPLIRTLLFNEDIIDVPKVEQALETRRKRPDFEKLLRQCTLLVAASFFLSAVLNFFLAKWIVTADPSMGPEAETLFNTQIGKMTFWGFIAIGLPTTAVMMLALWKLINGLTHLSGLKLEEVFPALAEAAEKEADQNKEPDDKEA